MTLAERLGAARSTLIAAGIAPSDAALDVDVLAREALGWDRARLLGSLREPVPALLEPAFSLWVERRALREPVAYITGRREFWNLTFQVTPAVLTPRPETELIVEEALSFLASRANARVADVGTGSGCLATAIAHEQPSCRVVATDISSAALAVADRNRQRLGAGNRVRIVKTAYLDGISGEFDLLVSNPPYIAETERGSLCPDVRHEPAVALFGGPDGLRDLRVIVQLAAHRLVPGGRAIVEFGAGQEAAIREVVSRHPSLKLVRIRQDLQGIPRTLVIERRLPAAGPSDALDS